MDLPDHLLEVVEESQVREGRKCSEHVAILGTRPGVLLPGLSVSPRTHHSSPWPKKGEDPWALAQTSTGPASPYLDMRSCTAAKPRMPFAVQQRAGLPVNKG